jgi:hypothetical protein
MAKRSDAARRFATFFLAAGRAGLMAAMSAAALSLGCSRGPSRVDAPQWDPPALAERIVRELDKNGDGQLNAQELSAAPGLATGVRLIDSDKNGEISQAELEARFQQFKDRRVGLRAHTFQVLYKGQPVPAAEVLFKPEPYLEGIIESAGGTTDAQGMVSPQTVDKGLPAMRVGYYRVQIKSPQLKLPAKYEGDGSPLGAEVSDSDDRLSYGVTQLKLTD